MKQLKERTEIAMAMNLGKYPVVKLDLEDEITVAGTLAGFRGSKVRVPWNYGGQTYYTVCTLNYWIEENKISLMSEGATLSARFGYNDVMEMFENANTPVLDKNQEFVLVVHDSKRLAVFLVNTTDYKNTQCQAPLKIDADLAGVIKSFVEAAK